MNGAADPSYYTGDKRFGFPEGATMTSSVKQRKERTGLLDYDTQIKGKLRISLLSLMVMFSWRTKIAKAPLRECVIVCFVLLLLFPCQRCAASSWTSWRCWTCNLSRRASSCRTWWTTCGGGVRSKASILAPLKNLLNGSPPESRGNDQSTYDDAHNKWELGRSFTILPSRLYLIFLSVSSCHFYTQKGGQQSHCGPGLVGSAVPDPPRK